MITDRIKALNYQILDSFPELDSQTIESIDSAIKVFYITRSINNKVLDKDAYKIYQSLEITPVDAGQNMYQAISILKNVARQNSRGAAQLKTAFCSVEDYNTHRSTIKLEGSFDCIISYTVLLPSPLINKGTIIGFCSSVFDGVTVDKLIVEGYIGV